MHLSRANSVSCLWPADILAIKIIVFVANIVVIVVIAVRCGLMENRYWPKDVCVRVRFYEKNCILSKVQNMNNERAVFSMQHFPLCKWSTISRTKWEQGHHAVSQTTIKAIFFRFTAKFYAVFIHRSFLHSDLLRYYFSVFFLGDFYDFRHLLLVCLKINFTFYLY